MPPALSVPGTAQSDVLLVDDDGGELEPLVEVAGGEAALTSIISSVLSEAVEAVSVDIERSEYPAPTPPRTADTFDAEALPPSRSRPQTRGSITGSRLSSSSVGTEQAREELAGIGGAVGEMVDGVFSQVAGDFPDSVPPSRPETGVHMVLACSRLNLGATCVFQGTVVSSRESCCAFESKGGKTHTLTCSVRSFLFCFLARGM